MFGHIWSIIEVPLFFVSCFDGRSIFPPFLQALLVVGSPGSGSLIDFARSVEPGKKGIVQTIPMFIYHLLFFFCSVHHLCGHRGSWVWILAL